jgi:hypothetical protein
MGLSSSPDDVCNAPVSCRDYYTTEKFLRLNFCCETRFVIAFSNVYFAHYPQCHPLYTSGLDACFSIVFVSEDLPGFDHQAHYVRAQPKVVIWVLKPRKILRKTPLPSVKNI